MVIPRNIIESIGFTDPFAYFNLLTVSSDIELKLLFYIAIPFP